MIGVDILDLNRIKKTYASLAKKILTEKEYNQYLKKTTLKSQIEFVGSRFAGKEAFFKAARKNVEFLDIEILNDDNKIPHIYYKGEEVGEISISHDKFAICVVLLDRKI